MFAIKEILLLYLVLKVTQHYITLVILLYQLDEFCLLGDVNNKCAEQSLPQCHKQTALQDHFPTKTTTLTSQTLWQLFKISLCMTTTSPQGKICLISSVKTTTLFQCGNFSKSVLSYTTTPSQSGHCQKFTVQKTSDQPK